MSSKHNVKKYAVRMLLAGIAATTLAAGAAEASSRPKMGRMVMGPSQKQERPKMGRLMPNGRPFMGRLIGGGKSTPKKVHRPRMGRLI